MVTVAEERSAAEVHKPGACGHDIARALVVVAAGPVLLAGAAGASVFSSARSLLALKLPRPVAAAGVIALAAYAAVVRPWHRSWGATAEERDTEATDGCAGSVHAITIDAPPERVWPWVAQIGQDRGGFYSYEWLENLAGCRMRNADAVHPEWQHREPGETVYLHPANGLKVTRFEPGRAFGLEGWGTIELEPLDGDRTRLVVRGSGKRGLELVSYVALIELPHFVMERRMLLGIKERAEAIP